MGTISEKLTYLNGTKQLLKDKINNLGGSIDDNTTFRQYANQLQNVYDNLPKTEYQEGTEVNLGKTIKGKLDFENGVVGIGQCEQNGEPTPSTPIAINSVTGNQDVVVSGKNLFEPVISVDGTQIIGNNMSNLGVTDGEFSFTANGTDVYFGQVLASGSTYTANRGIKIYRNGNEKISYKISNTEINRNFITAYDSNGTSLGYVEKSGSSQGIYTFPDNCEFVTFRIGKGNAVSGTTYTFNVIVAYGDEIPDYEPYITPTSYQLSLGDIELCGIGNYKDELVYDVDEDKVYKKAYIGMTEITSRSSIVYDTSLTSVSRFRTTINNVVNATDSGKAYCNYFTLVNGFSLDSEHFYIYGTANNKTMYFFINNDIASSLAELQTWLANRTIKVYYILLTPTLTELTDTTLKQQVKNWYYSQSFNGTTILESNGDLPMIIKVRGLKGA